MAILKIARMGHPVLLQRCEPVPDPGAPEIRRLVADMMETMEDAPGVGLAAPQVYVPLRLFVLNWEGGLSIPGLRAGVPRAPRVRYRGVDCDGNVVEREVSGFHARIVQHEYDHLDGILYTMRMTDFRLFGFNEELSRLAAAQGR